MEWRRGPLPHDLLSFVDLEARQLEMLYCPLREHLARIICHVFLEEPAKQIAAPSDREAEVGRSGAGELRHDTSKRVERRLRVEPRDRGRLCKRSLVRASAASWSPPSFASVILSQSRQLNHARGRRAAGIWR